MVKNPFRAETAFDPLLHSFRERADRIMVGMNLFLTLVCVALAPMRDTYLSVALIALPTLALSYVLWKKYPGALATRLFMGCGFMAYTGLIIHQSGGEIEGHFSAFGLIGVLLYYRDWRAIIVATVAIYLHHLILGYAQTLGVPIYVFNTPEFWKKFVIHVAYFLPFIGMMCYLAIWLRREGYEEQHVISLAQEIIRGNLVKTIDHPLDEEKMPLVSAVVSMKNRLVDLLRVMPVASAVVRLDTGKLVSVNEAWEQRIWRENDFSKNFADAPFWKDAEEWGQLLSYLNEAENKLLNKVEVTLLREDGTPFVCELSVILHSDNTPAMAILTIEDISQRRMAEQQMHRLAYRDMLTDMPNRSSLHDALQLALTKFKEEAVPFAVVMMDLDGFKPVNDAYGHDAGDAVLKVVGARLMRNNRSADLAARMGGDEFAIVLHGCPRIETAMGVAERCIEAVSRPIMIESQLQMITVGMSAGVTYVTGGQPTMQGVLKEADMALYEAKLQGKNRAHQYQAEWNSRVDID